MPIESKEVLEYLNIDGAEKFEDFRAKFESAYIKKTPSAIKEDKELYGAIVGKLTGSVRTSFLRDIKKQGVELKDEEIEGLEIEKIIDTGLGKLKTVFSTQIEEVKKNAGKPSQELEQAWTERLTKKDEKIRDLQTLLDTSKQEWQNKEAEFTGQLKNIKLDTRRSDLEREFKWASDADELKKEGFKSVMSKKYKLDLDENGDALEIFNAKGERIPNPKKNGTFKTPLEVFEEEGIAAKVWATNPVAGRATPRPVMQHIESPAFPQNGRPGRAVHPAAQAAEGRS